MKFFTDGSCLGNPGPGGWAVFSFTGGGTRLKGGDMNTTNNRMELQAIIEAVKHIHALQRLDASPTKCTIFSDSQWSVNVVNQTWRARTNLDLVYTALESIDQLTIRLSIEWMRGHNQEPNNQLARGNAIADSMANEEARYQLYLSQIPLEQ